MIYPDISNLSYVALDTETTGLKWYRDRPFCLTVAGPGIKSFAVDLEDSIGLRWACKQIPMIKRAVFHNSKFDCHMLRNLDVKFDYDKVDCTLIMATLINEHEHSYSLDHLSEKYLKVRKMTGLYDRLAEIYGGPATKKQMNNIYPCWKSPNRQLVIDYAIQDVEVTKALYEFLHPMIEEQDLSKVYKLEMGLMPVLMDMERQGVSVDLERTEETRKRLVKQIEKAQSALDAIAGFNVNINSPKDLPILFGSRLDGDKWVTSTGEPLPLTPGGKASFSAESLQSLKDERAKMVLGIRQTDKLVSTFIDGHILGNHQNGRVHTNFNQTRQEVEYGTVTGRLSSSEPNLQQIPKRNKILAQQIRSLFIPERGDVWHCWDYSQIDFRFFAHYVNSPGVIKQYADNPDVDFHSMVAEMTGLPRTSTPGIRGNAKQINLGLVFGMGEGTLAEEMGLPFTIEKGRSGKEYKKPGEEALEVFRKYHKAIPGIKDFLQKASSVATDRGYVKSIMGRRLRFPNKGMSYKAGGYLFQSATAELIKLKLIEIHHVLKGTEGKLLLSVHDEADISMPPDPALQKKITAALEDFKLRIPIRCSLGVGADWWAASK